MTQSNDLPNRVERLQADNIDLKLAVSSLIETVNLHQSNFETIQRNFESMQRNMQRNFEAIVSEIHEIRDDTRAMQSEIRGLQTENQRILNYLLGQQGNGNEG